MLIFSANNYEFYRILLFCFFAVSSASAQGTVKLLNLSFPHTEIEDGNYVKVLITGATANGTVSVVQNGNPAFTWSALVDPSGSWAVTSLETSANIGSYSQTWYVNGTALTPEFVSGDSVFEATLPSFSVYMAQTPASPSVMTYPTCSQPATTLKWIWTPVSYYVISSYGSAAGTAGGGGTVLKALSHCSPPLRSKT